MGERKRTIQMKFYANDEEKILVDRKVKLSKYKKCEYFRNMALNDLIRMTKIKSPEALIEEINKIGIEVNNIAKNTNQNHYINEKGIISIIDKLYKLYNTLQNRLL